MSNSEHPLWPIKTHTEIVLHGEEAAPRATDASLR
jgi:hypothetical protein